MKQTRKHLSFDQKRYLVHLYVTGGFEAAKPFAVKYGIKPKYVANLARQAGHKNHNYLAWLAKNNPQRAREIFWPWARKNQEIAA